MGDATTLYGLTVDNAVEFEVMTVDGEVRIINECVATGLFWTMRGVDAATFDVLTKYIPRAAVPGAAHPDLHLVAKFSASSDVLRQILTAHVQTQLNSSEALVAHYLVD